MSDDLFGSKGIDTPYERQLVEYHPELTYPDKRKFFQLDPQTILNIERARDFSISSSLIQYDDTMTTIQSLMDMIEKRNQTSNFAAFKTALDNNQNVKDLENQLCGYDGSGDAELYHLLYKMLASCNRRRDFLDTNYRTQFTNETDTSEISQAENDSIDEWYSMQNQFLDLQHQLTQSQDDAETYLMPEVYNQEIAVNNKAAFHTTLADTGYIHRNRTAIFNSILSQIQILVTNPQSLMPNDLKDGVMTMMTGDATAMKAHLIFAFNQLKISQNASKGAYTMMDDDKEDYISEQQWFHQQLQTSVNNPLKNWLYNQSDSNESFNQLANILVGSLSQSQSSYDNSNQDLLKFYQQEGNFYSNQLSFIQQKEQIREYLRIIEDLEDVNSLTDDWVTNYLLAQGYSIL